MQKACSFQCRKQSNIMFSSLISQKLYEGKQPRFSLDRYLPFFQIQVLTISRNTFKDIPDLSQLDNLTAFDGSFNKISSLRPKVFALPKILKVLLHNNLIKIIPPEIAIWKTVTELDISSNLLESVSVGIGNLDQLQGMLQTHF